MEHCWQAGFGFGSLLGAGLGTAGGDVIVLEAAGCTVEARTGPPSSMGTMGTTTPPSADCTPPLITVVETAVPSLIMVAVSWAAKPHSQMATFIGAECEDALP